MWEFGCDPALELNIKHAGKNTHHGGKMGKRKRGERVGSGTWGAKRKEHVYGSKARAVPA